MRGLPIAAGVSLLLLGLSWSVSAVAAERASAARTSRWWTLDCGAAQRAGDVRPPACLLTLRLHGAIGPDRLRLVQAVVRRRDGAQRSMHRDVAVHVDVDSEGGQVFAAMEIGRILRSEKASISVEKGASCNSACVFVLMGATRRSVARGARVGIHRPSIGEAGGDANIDAIADQIRWYVEQMNVSPGIVPAMMSIPSDQMRFLTPAELDAYGIRVSASGGAPRAR